MQAHRKTYQTIPVYFAQELLKSQYDSVRGMVLCYLKLRQYYGEYGGNFRVDEQLSNRILVSKKTLRKYLTQALELGWIRVNPHNQEYFQVCSIYRIYHGVMKGKRSGWCKSMILQHNDLASIRFRKPSKLRALLSEGANEQYLAYKTWKEKKANQSTTYKRTVDRDGVVSKATKKKRAKTKQSFQGVLVQLAPFSTLLGAALASRSISTISRYRKLQKLVTYTHTPKVVGDVYPGCEEDNYYYNHRDKTNSMNWGYRYVNRGLIWESPVSVRKGTALLAKVRIANKYRDLGCTLLS